jgi:hypothetical protein
MPVPFADIYHPALFAKILHVNLLLFNKSDP